VSEQITDPDLVAVAAEAQKYERRIAELEAENARLRDGLRRVVYCSTSENVTRIAQASLSPLPGEDGVLGPARLTDVPDESPKETYKSIVAMRVVARLLGPLPGDTETAQGER